MYVLHTEVYIHSVFLHSATLFCSVAVLKRLQPCSLDKQHREQLQSLAISEAPDRGEHRENGHSSSHVTANTDINACSWWHLPGYPGAQYARKPACSLSEHVGKISPAAPTGILSPAAFPTAVVVLLSVASPLKVSSVISLVGVRRMFHSSGLV